MHADLVREYMLCSALISMALLWAHCIADLHEQEACNNNYIISVYACHITQSTLSLIVTKICMSRHIP